MKLKLLYCFVALILIAGTAGRTFAAPPNWVPVPNLQYNMQVVAKLQMPDGTFSNNPLDLVGAFVGSQCRGLGTRDPNLQEFFFITVGSNVPSGEMVTFQAYLGNFDLVVNVIQVMPFVSGSQVGTLSNPVIFTFSVANNVITASSGPHGTINPSGEVTVPWGGNQLFTFSPITGYQVSNVLVNGVSVGTPTQYQFNGVTQNQTIHVTFAPAIYFHAYIVWANGSIAGDTYQLIPHGGNGTPVTVIPDQGYFFTQWDDGITANPRTDLNVTQNKIISTTLSANTYTLTYTAGPNGSLSGQTTQTVVHGGNGTPVTAIPNTGFQFIRWSDGIYSNPRTDINVNSNINVTAIFGLNTFTITATAGPNGSISPSGTPQVEEGGDILFTITPNTGYEVANVVVNNQSLGPMTSYLFTNVTSNQSIHATFQIRSYTLSYSSDGNGSLTGNTLQTVIHGGNGTPVLATPYISYHFVQWSDGKTDNPRTDLNVSGNIQVVAQFALNTYTILATANANGTINPSGLVVVNEGASPTFLIQPNTGSSIEDVKVDGVSIGPVSIYQFVNVVENHTIEADFELNYYILRYLSDGNGFLTGDTLQEVSHGGHGTPVYAFPNPGYIFAGWSDGNYQNPRIDMNVTASRTVTALFTDSGPPVWVPTGNLEYNMQVVARLMRPDSSFCTNPADIVASFSGLECRGIAHPFPEYEGLLFLTIGSNIHTGEIITFKAYIEDINLVVDLNEIIEFVSMSEIGTPDNPFIFSYEDILYQISASAGPNGRIVPEGDTLISHGSSIVYTFIPDEGFMVKEVFVNNIPQGASETYEFTMLSSEKTIHVVFDIDTRTEALQPENRLSIYPNPATNLIRINTGAEAWDNIPVRIDITDMHGRNVISMMTYEPQAEIYVAALRPGIYSVRTSKNGLVLGSAKFSKTHEN
jgi:hypothetical protein